MKPLFSVPAATTSGTAAPASKVSPRYSIPVYPNDVPVVSRDGLWVGKQGIMVHKDAASASTAQRSYAGAQVQHVDALLDRLFRGEKLTTWRRKEQVPFCFVTHTGPDAVDDNVYTELHYRPVYTFVTKKDFVFVDAAFGPPPSRLYSCPPNTSPMVDAVSKTEASLLLAPMFIENGTLWWYVGQLVLRSEPVAAHLLASLDVMVEDLSYAVQVRRQDLYRSVRSAQIENPMLKPLMKIVADFSETKGLLSREAILDLRNRAFDVVKSYLTLAASSR